MKKKNPPPKKKKQQHVDIGSAAMKWETIENEEPLDQLPAVKLWVFINIFQIFFTNLFWKIFRVNNDYV